MALAPSVLLMKTLYGADMRDVSCELEIGDVRNGNFGDNLLSSMCAGKNKKRLQAECASDMHIIMPREVGVHCDMSG